MTCLPAGNQSVLDSNIFASTNGLEPSATHLCQLLKESVSVLFGVKTKDLSLFTPQLLNNPHRDSQPVPYEKNFFEKAGSYPKFGGGREGNTDSMYIHAYL